ncbi:hypothetical protein R3W88_033042 [Solanum pinnatisectum]|uniref:MADS-box domain-containing protein n=1 Tax=Solanum pinnatisectum TaxID=50273 RepID=A0AAV9K248_9SOLN|nr:hypothetical protein R3W88_033042 [Solanum pinnatisectum]
MARKIEIKKIEDTKKHKVSFYKRRNSLLNKEKEIAICCDEDVLFVAFSPTDRLNKFSSQQRIEDMLQRYINLPVKRRLTHMGDVKMELEKQGKMNVHFVAQGKAPQQFDTNNWVNPYSRSIQESIHQYSMNKGKRVANSSNNYTYIPSFASSPKSGNIPFFQIHNTSPYIPLQVLLFIHAVTRIS